MVAIETSYGRFEAETIKEAQSAARKAEREARKRSMEREERRKIAEQRAECNGYRVLMWVAGEYGGLANREYRKADDQWSGIERTGERGEYRIHTADGVATINLYHDCVILGALQNPSGVVAIVLRYSDGEHVYAIGTCDGQTDLTKLPATFCEDTFAAARPQKCDD